MTNSPEQAIALARRQSTGPGHFPVGTCLLQVRLCYDVPAGIRSAAESWAGAKDKHPCTSSRAIPRGVPVFWTGGSHGFGHIAISVGNGRCLSSDIMRPGKFDEVPIDLIAQRWGLRLAGWSEDFNGVRVWTAFTHDKHLPVPPAPVAHATPYDEAYALAEQIVALGKHVQKKYPARRRLIDGVAALLKTAPVPASRKAKR